MQWHRRTILLQTRISFYQRIPFLPKLTSGMRWEACTQFWQVMLSIVVTQRVIQTLLRLGELLSICSYWRIRMLSFIAIEVNSEPLRWWWDEHRRLLSTKSRIGWYPISTVQFPVECNMHLFVLNQSYRYSDYGLQMSNNWKQDASFLIDS